MIINSLLDNDYYKLTQMQFVYHQFPDVDVEYEFKCRSGEDMSPFKDQIEKEIYDLCGLTFQKDEIDYLRDQKIFQEDFLLWLYDAFSNLNPYNIRITKNPFTLTIKGDWLRTILFEVPILAIISEIYFKNAEYNKEIADIKLFKKVFKAQGKGFTFSDFGTRRRFSFECQDRILRYFLVYKEFTCFNGTSNVYFAKKYNLQPVGTMAHELFMAHQALVGNLNNFQKVTLQGWLDEYNGKLGIALSDTIGIDAFLKDFKEYANAYSGIRQDSGDPFVIGNKVIAFYKEMGIDPKTKTLIFSDGLNFDKAADLYKEFSDKINVSFGIGTNLTNDIEGVKPLSMVIKMQRCNGKPVAKISDEPAKAQCQDEEYLKKLKKTFGVE
jgi:nicotinate phosphoribosyltransferase